MAANLRLIPEDEVNRILRVRQAKVLMSDIWLPNIVIKRLKSAVIIEHKIGFPGDVGVTGAALEREYESSPDSSIAPSDVYASDDELLCINESEGLQPVYNAHCYEHHAPECKAANCIDPLFVKTNDANNNNNNNLKHRDAYNRMKLLSDDCNENMDSDADSQENQYQFLENILRDLDADDSDRTMGQEADSLVTPASSVFGSICLASLENKCYGVFSCTREHTLLSNEQVRQNLEVCERADIESAHNDYLLKYEKLMDKYWSVFARCYGHKKWPEYLRRSIEAVAGKRNSAHLGDIVNGLVIGGIEYHTAVDLVLLELPESMDMGERFHLMWAIVLDARNKRVRDHLKAFEPSILKEATDGTAEMFINTLLAQLVVNEFADLKMFCVGLLKHCAITTLRGIDTETLDKFVSNLYASHKVDADAIARRIAQFGTAPKIEW